MTVPVPKEPVVQEMGQGQFNQAVRDQTKLETLPHHAEQGLEQVTTETETKTIELYPVVNEMNSESDPEEENGARTKLVEAEDHWPRRTERGKVSLPKERVLGLIAEETGSSDLSENEHEGVALRRSKRTGMSRPRYSSPE
ncbi:hypothetical protein NDU88_002524 [Pleurodeles waltl]|uniref:Uncharacterized protein n=1 Tax=Pleurodeles waltl TaxID=8319 RepID=A0AAV7MP32_PLEWA|nr:hypothetical protein NDU88_002524 [Pleurodeles waltl]